MNRLCDPRFIEALKRRFGFSFSKALGQNFLINEAVPRAIAAASGADGETGVIEIGPGFGSLTYELCRAAARVAAVELDKSLLPVLAETLGEFENLSVISGDFLKLDTKKLMDDEFYSRGINKVVVCANLPYYITTPIIMALLEQRLPLKSITVMVQKEVARRLCAGQPGPEWGAVTLAIQYRCRAELLFEVPAADFMPRPKVDSAVIRLDILEKPPVLPRDEAHMFRLIGAAFAHRRKTLANSVSMSFGLPRERVLAALEQAGIPAQVRGERLTLSDFAKLSDILNLI